MNEDDYLPISYLNDLLFCERRAALHLIEGVWKDNQYTTEGLLAHKRVDVPKNLLRGDNRRVSNIGTPWRLGIPDDRPNGPQRPTRIARISSKGMKS